MIGARFHSCYMVDVSGICKECQKPFKKRLTRGAARRLKHKLCGSYRCKLAHLNKQHKEREERAKRRAQG